MGPTRRLLHPPTSSVAMASTLALRTAARRVASASFRRPVAVASLKTLAAPAPGLAGPSRSSFAKAAPSIISRNVQSSAVGSHIDGVEVPESEDEPFSVFLQEDTFHGYRLEVPQNEIKVTKKQLVEMYRTMTQMRRMEMAADKLYKEKLIRGFCHLAIGQEAVSVGMESAIEKDDKVITSYRCHPFAVLRGGTVKGVIAELLGREDGMSHGKGGSMHIFTKSFFAGIALAQQYMGQADKHATFIMYGDGASNQGQVFESFNMAKLWNLPAVFVCENNLYGMGTSAERSSSNTKYYTRGDLIPGLQINGMDVLAVHAGIKFAKEWTQSGKGPLVLEMVTYRYGGHSMSDPGTTYRTREEIQHMRSANDPITGLKQRLLDWGIVTEDELKAMEKEIRKSIDASVEEAKASPEPSLKEMWTDIYFEGTAPAWMRGREAGEIHHYSEKETQGKPTREVIGVAQLTDDSQTDSLGRLV